jgi:hypothetical protein
MKLEMKKEIKQNVEYERPKVGDRRANELKTKKLTG